MCMAAVNVNMAALEGDDRTGEAARAGPETKCDAAKDKQTGSANRAPVFKKNFKRGMPFAPGKKEKKR